MKYIILCLILVISLGTLPAVSASSTYSPGLITSDNPFWVLDLKLEEITESLMLTDDATINLQMKHANERIGEMQQTSNKTKVVEQYIKVLNRMGRVENLEYKTTVAAQAQLQEHIHVIMSQTQQYNGEIAPMLETTMMLEQLIRTENKLEDRTGDIINNESLWWSEKVAEYNIITSPTPIENYGNFDKYIKYLNEDIIVIDVVNSDNTLMQSYIIRNDADITTIQIGTTDNYVDKYIITIETLKRQEALL